MTAFESLLRLAALVLGLLCIVSFFITPASSFLSMVFGVLTLVIVLGEARILLLLPLVQIIISSTSLYFLGEALLFEYPNSLSLGVALSAIAILVVYVQSKALILRKGIGKIGITVLATISLVLVYTITTSLPAIKEFMEGKMYEGIEIAAYSGLLFIGASLPFSSLILFSLVYLTYDLLRSAGSKELIQPSQEAGKIGENSVVFKP